MTYTWHGDHVLPVERARPVSDHPDDVMRTLRTGDHIACMVYRYALVEGIPRERREGVDVAGGHVLAVQRACLGGDDPNAGVSEDDVAGRVGGDAGEQEGQGRGECRDAVASGVAIASDDIEVAGCHLLAVVGA